MREDNVLICFDCCEIRDEPSEESIERFGDIVLQCCDKPMLKYNRSKLVILAKNLDTIKDRVEHMVVEGYNVS